MHFTPPHVSISFQLSFNLAFSFNLLKHPGFFIILLYVSLTLVQVKQVSVININDLEHMGLFHLISVPPCRGYMFLIVIPLRNSKLKTLYPWGIPSLKHFILEEFQAVTNSKLKTFYPWRIPSSKHISPKEFHAQNTLPLRNSKVKIFYPWRIPVCD